MIAVVFATVGAIVTISGGLGFGRFARTLMGASDPGAIARSLFGRSRGQQEMAQRPD